MQAKADAKKAEEGVPELVDGWESQGLRLTPSEGFLLSRIDGVTPWASLRQIAGMPADEVDACLARWIAQGIVALADAPLAAVVPAEPAPGALDPGLDLPLELQRRILDFEARLDRPYHELLGVPADADARTIKRAFFALSKEFHPDRYFRRNVGSCGPRLARIFKRVALAYEMLSDPATRAELQRQPQAAAPAASDAAPEAPPRRAAAKAAGAVEPGRAPKRAAAATGAATPRTRKREALDRLRRHFRIPEEVLRERRFRAGRLHDAARQEFARGRFAEAASAMRLAIAFDPWNDAYKDEFAAVQAELHHERATELLAGGGAAAGGADTLRQLEEALHFRPSDARLHHRAADLALELGEIERAHEYAERACELADDVAAHFSTLGRALRRMGEGARARQAFERAQEIDPGDADAARELDRARRQRPARTRGGGSR